MKFRNGIIIAMITFVAFIVTLALVINSKDTELISEDYYIQEKSFNQDYEAQQRSENHHNPIKLIESEHGISFVNQSDLSITFIEATFQLMNNGKADFTLKNHPLNVLISKDKLAKGIYQIQLRYEVNKLPYLQVVTWQYK
ncbi:MAG: FixH [Bacteroidota bacterium]